MISLFMPLDCGALGEQQVEVLYEFDKDARQPCVHVRQVMLSRGHDVMGLLCAKALVEVIDECIEHALDTVEAGHEYH